MNKIRKSVLANTATDYLKLMKDEDLCYAYNAAAENLVRLATDDIDVRTIDRYLLVRKRFEVINNEMEYRKSERCLKIKEEFKEYKNFEKECLKQYKALKVVELSLKNYEMVKDYLKILPNLSIKYAMYASSIKENNRMETLDILIFKEYSRRKAEKQNTKSKRK